MFATDFVAIEGRMSQEPSMRAAGCIGPISSRIGLKRIVPVSLHVVQETKNCLGQDTRIQTGCLQRLGGTNGLRVSWEEGPGCAVYDGR